MIFYTIFLSIFLIFTIFLLFIITSAFLGFLITRVPFVTTPAKELEFVIKELEISEKDIFYDIGSGNGKICFLVNKLTGARTKGFELTWWTHLYAKYKARYKKINTEFINKNFFKQDWSEATVIYTYLYPPLMRRVREKFKKECRVGSIAIVRDFPFPEITPEKIYKFKGKHEIYVYRNGG